MYIHNSIVHEYIPIHNVYIYSTYVCVCTYIHLQHICMYTHANTLWMNTSNTQCVNMYIGAQHSAAQCPVLGGIASRGVQYLTYVCIYMPTSCAWIHTYTQCVNMYIDTYICIMYIYMFAYICILYTCLHIYVQCVNMCIDIQRSVQIWAASHLEGTHICYSQMHCVWFYISRCTHNFICRYIYIYVYIHVGNIYPKKKKHSAQIWAVSHL